MAGTPRNTLHRVVKGQIVNRTKSATAYKRQNQESEESGLVISLLKQLHLVTLTDEVTSQLKVLYGKKLD